MKEALRQYLDTLFVDAPETVRMLELKEEIFQNLTDKYDDLIAEGKSEQAAYDIAVVSIGDVRALIDAQAGGAANTKEREKARQRSALFVSIAVGLYILSIIPVVLMANPASVGIMFAMAAVATGLLIYNGATRPRYVKSDDTVVEEFKAWKEEKSGKKSGRGAFTGALWLAIVSIYLLLSFFTNAWYITWIIFPIGGAVSLVISGIFDLKQ